MQHVRWPILQLLQSVGDSASGDVQSARNRTVSTGSGQRWVSTASTVAVGMGRNACAIIHGHVAAARAPSGRHGGGTSSRPSPIQPVLSCFWPWTRPVRRGNGACSPLRAPCRGGWTNATCSANGGAAAAPRPTVCTASRSGLFACICTLPPVFRSVTVTVHTLHAMARPP